MSTVPPSPIRVLIADDHALLRSGVAAVMAAYGNVEVVGEAENGQQAIEQFLRLQPDVTLMDLQMPVMGGLDAMIAIRSLNASARIIVLTTYKGDTQVGRAIRAGAAGYLLKGAIRMDLLDAIQTVHAGRSYVPPEVALEMASFFSQDALSVRELEVLRLVAHGNANKEVGRLLSIKEETVKAHMSTVLAKLGAKDRTHAVMIAMRRGILDA
jgi:two-component system NarL family response regulator